MNLQAADAEAAKVAVAPRVTLADIEAAIAAQYNFTARAAIDALGMPAAGRIDESPLSVLSVCILVLNNGFTVIGKSAPASPQNFNAELGQKLATEDAKRQLWPLMGFALRDKLAVAA